MHFFIYISFLLATTVVGRPMLPGVPRAAKEVKSGRVPPVTRPLKLDRDSALVAGGVGGGIALGVGGTLAAKSPKVAWTLKNLWEKTVKPFNEAEFRACMWEKKRLYGIRNRIFDEQKLRRLDLPRELTEEWSNQCRGLETGNVYIPVPKAQRASTKDKKAGEDAPKDVKEPGLKDEPSQGGIQDETKKPEEPDVDGLSNAFIDHGNTPAFRFPNPNRLRDSGVAAAALGGTAAAGRWALNFLPSLGPGAASIYGLV